MSNPQFYRHCSEDLIAAWKKYPLQNPLTGPNPSDCCNAKTILVLSKEGGYVRQCCMECREPSEVGWHEFYALNIPMSCPSCRGEMAVKNRDTQLLGVPGNFVYVCHQCREYVQLADLVPHWSEVSHYAFDSVRNPSCGVRQAAGELRSTFLRCPTCQCLRETIEEPIPCDGSRGNFHHPDHADLQWLERNRICLTCQGSFSTAELSKDFISELATFRDKVKVLLTQMGVVRETAQKSAVWLNELVVALEDVCELQDPSAGGRSD